MAIQQKQVPLLKISPEEFGSLLKQLQAKQYTILGPTVKNQAIVYDVITNPDDLPVGWRDEKKKGAYRIKKEKNGSFFNYTVGPESWKKFLLPAFLKIWKAERNSNTFDVKEFLPVTEKYAFLGVRPCELKAITILDQVLLRGNYIDKHYQEQREKLFIIAVNCTKPAETCFCTSLKTGPHAVSDFDLAITEIVDEHEHYFLVEIGSNLGKRIFKAVPHEKAGASEQEAALRTWQQAEDSMGRSIDTTEIKNLLYRNLEHPEWETVSSRCLTCANCTMVCPTCFCTTFEDTTDLKGVVAERIRKWDSCFTMDFSYIHGGSVRHSLRSRYRHRILHKLATWVDQFGEFGCVGCGRCITWCPVGLDLTEEIKIIQNR